MPFDVDLISRVAPFGGHLGSLALRVRHTGAYTRNTQLDLSELIPPNTGLDQVLAFSPVRFERTGLILAPNTRSFRPGVTVTGCVVTAGRAVVTTSAAHYLVDGERVRIRNVQGSTEINGEWDIEWLSTTTFAIAAVTSITTYSASTASYVEAVRPRGESTVSGATTAGVFTTSAAHGLSAGDMIFLTTVAGLTGATQTYVNTLCQVLTVPSSTTLTIKTPTGLLTFTGGAFSGTAYVVPVRTVKNCFELAIRQQRTLGIASATIASPSVLTMQDTHNFQIGDRVWVSSVLDSTVGGHLNGSRRVRTTPAATTLTLETEAGVAVNAATGTNTANTGLVTGVFELPSAEAFYDEVVLNILLAKRDGRSAAGTKMRLMKY